MEVPESMKLHPAMPSLGAVAKPVPSFKQLKAKALKEIADAPLKQTSVTNEEFSNIYDAMKSAKNQKLNLNSLQNMSSEKKVVHKVPEVLLTVAEINKAEKEEKKKAAKAKK